MTDTQPSTRRTGTLALVATAILWIGGVVVLPRRPATLTLLLAAPVIATPLGLSLLSTPFRARTLLAYLLVWAGGLALVTGTALRDDPTLVALVLVASLAGITYGLARYGPQPRHHPEEDPT